MVIVFKTGGGMGLRVKEEDLSTGEKRNWIRCTSWLNAGSRIIENNLRGCFFLILAPVGGSNPAGPYHNPFPRLIFT